MPRGKELGNNAKKSNYTITFNSNDDKDVIDFLEGQRDKSALIRGLVRDYVNSGELPKLEDNIDTNKKRYYTFYLNADKNKDIIDVLERYASKAGIIREIIRDCISQENLPLEIKKNDNKNKHYTFILNDEEDGDVIEALEYHEIKTDDVKKIIRDYIKQGKMPPKKNRKTKKNKYYKFTFNEDSDKDIIDALEGYESKSNVIKELIRCAIMEGNLPQKSDNEKEYQENKCYTFALDDKEDKDIIEVLETYKSKSGAIKEMVKDRVAQGNLPQKINNKKVAKKKKSYSFTLNDEDDEDLIEFFDGYKAKSALVNKLIREYMAELSKKD